MTIKPVKKNLLATRCTSSAVKEKYNREAFPVDTAASLQRLINAFSGDPIEVSFRDLVSWIKVGERATHYLHSYPAKLLPQIAHYFLAASTISRPGDIVLDPFGGTGTVALESVLAGRTALFADPNPLARLIATTKTTAISARKLDAALERVRSRFKLSRDNNPPDVVNLEYWFYPQVIRSLCRLKVAILFLMRFLVDRDIRSFDLMYTEPRHYSRKADTAFSLDEASTVRQVAGFEGQHSTDMSNDVLIMGAGYDHPLISKVILSKDNSRVVQLHGLPSLSADMYHEAVLRLDRVGGRFDVAEDHLFFSSANDPFVTAAVLSDAYRTLQTTRPITNLYLSTLATKPQAVGFGLFYLSELANAAASIIFPCIKKYNRETGQQLGRSWIYPINV